MANSIVYDEFLFCPELTPAQQLLSHSDPPTVEVAPDPPSASQLADAKETKANQKRQKRKFARMRRKKVTWKEQEDDG